MSFVNRLVELVPKDRISVLVIDKNRYWVSGPAHTEIAQGVMHLEGVIGVIPSISNPPLVNFVNAEVGMVDPENRVVYTNIGEVKYDYLFVGTGMVFADWEVPGLMRAQNLTIYYAKTALAFYYATEQMKEGNVVIAIPPAPYKCGPAPFETAFMTYQKV